MTWNKHPDMNIWELQKGKLRARILPIQHHCSIYMWGVLVSESEEPFAELKYYVDIAGGDSFSSDDAKALAESQRDAEQALLRAVPCKLCGGVLDPEAQYANRPGVACPECKSAGWVTNVEGLPTGVS